MGEQPTLASLGPEVLQHDAAIVVCPRERTETVLGQLPSAALWQRLYRDAHNRGPVTLLSARVTLGAIPVVLAFAKTTASAFERLLLGAQAWKELAPPPAARVLLATCGLEDPKASAAALEAKPTGSYPDSASVSSANSSSARSSSTTITMSPLPRGNACTASSPGRLISPETGSQI